MAGKPLHELRRAAAQARGQAVPAKEKKPAVEPAVEKKTEPAPERSMNEILSDAKIRAAKGEENEDILAMVKSIKSMLRGE